MSGRRRVCECGSEPGPCENGSGASHEPVDFHDHEYGEWWCQGCWQAYGGGPAGVVRERADEEVAG